MKRKIKGSLLVLIGYLLSPFSWWNDLVFNIPIAYLFALPFGFISREIFFPMMIFGYWVTNVVGLLLLHYGAKNFLSKEESRYSKKEIIKDVILSVIYTFIVILFIKIGWLRFPSEYFG